MKGIKRNDERIKRGAELGRGDGRQGGSTSFTSFGGLKPKSYLGRGRSAGERKERSSVPRKM